MISFIVPTCNSGWNIAPLLDSILNQLHAGDEVIVVDDASTDDTVQVAAGYADRGVRVIRMDINRGPAAARNAGARAARGEFLFFLDSDTRLEPGSVAAFETMIRERPEIRCINGINRRGIDRNPAARYKALVEYDWVAHLPDGYDELSCFNTRVGVISRDVFFATPGMNEAYRRADVEDYQFGYDVLALTKIHLNKGVSVRHRFGSVKQITRNYYKRAAMWLELSRNTRRRFDKVGTSARSVVEYASGAAALGVSVLSMLLPPLWPAAVAAWVVFLVAIRRLLALTLREAGLTMVPVVLVFHVYFAVVILASAAVAVMPRGPRARAETPPMSTP
jgi:glycosyltransferase involved in cell wall biosynthesis